MAATCGFYHPAAAGFYKFLFTVMRKYFIVKFGPGISAEQNSVFPAIKAPIGALIFGPLTFEYDIFKWHFIT